ncbi:MAG: response regulator [Planctomycetota bacterium]|nr:response regulator [Planctomycetota bacterium]
MSQENVLKSLSRETKALIMVSEFEARRMPMFQMRSVLNAIVNNEEEKKVIIDLVENDLKATGYHPNQITSFLQDLLAEETAPQAAAETNVRVTRRLRSPFSMGFEEQVPGLRASGGAPGIHPVQTPPPGTVAAPIRTPPAGSPQIPAAPSPAGSDGNQAVGPSGSGSRTGSVPSPTGSGSRIPGVGPAAKPGLNPGGQRISNTVVTGLQRPQVPGAMPRPNIGPAEAPPQMRSGGVKGTADKDEVFFGSRPAGVAGNQNIKPKVLLADDDKRIRIVFRLTLERLGFEVIEAADGNEAWKRVQKGGLALLVIDMKMPGLHGLEVLQRMVDQGINMAVIICSAYDQLKDEFIVATHPSLRYLVKPVSSEALEAAVRDLVGIPAEQKG